MEAMRFVGWIEEILPAGDYEQKFSVANYRNDDSKAVMLQNKEFPNVLMFSINVKNGANSQLDGLNRGDKVEIKYFLAGKSGISKSKGTYYCVNNLNVAKSNGITVIERQTVDPAGQPSAEEELDIPF